MKRIIGSASIISACILLSRVLGFLRDMLCTGFFGPVWDAFAFAFTIPNLFRRLFGEGALSAAFIPTFSHYLNNEKHSETIRFINIVITILFGFLTLIALLVILLTFIVPLVIPLDPNSSFSPIFFKLLRIMIPYMPLICLVALLQAILNSLKHFAMPALASVFLNICWISGFVIASLTQTTDENKVLIMAWAILIGGILEVVIQIPPLVSRKITYRPQINFAHPGFREVVRLMGPTIFGLAVFQINLLADYIIAQIFVPEPGAISALYFANRLMQFPFALIGISMATAVFPFLAEYVAKNNVKGMLGELKHILALSLFVGLPASIGLVVTAEPLINWAFSALPASLFHINAFSASAIARTANVLIFYSIGIWSYSAVQIINRAFYSLKDMTTPVRIGIYTVAANLAMNLILVGPLREGGIALATAISSFLNLFILLAVLGKKSAQLSNSDSHLVISFIKSLIPFIISSLLMGIGCYWAIRFVPIFPEIIPETLRIIGITLLGALLYLVLAYLFHRKFLKETFRIIFSKRI
ncbi:MAG: murein biosynthesis integral membrane protein MurJ [Planctomycetes bacterium]|nr:murein biosynthesis integral membrane protein MurJ [Planctomycetota bacterium]